jgi:hypothetical protein
MHEGEGGAKALDWNIINAYHYLSFSQLVISFSV